MDALLKDIRYAVRRLRHAPAFALIVIATLALGIGANSAIFSVINTVLLTPAPYRQPDQLVTMFHFYPGLKLEASVSAMGFKDDRDRTHSFSGVTVQTGWNVNLTGTGQPERLNGQQVSGLFFSVLGINPVRGRALTEADDVAGHNRVVVLSDGLWKRDFGSRPGVVGQTVSLNGVAYQVVGVMPSGFVDPRAPNAEIWTPIALDPARFTVNQYTNEFLALTARLKPGVTPTQAKSEMAAFAEQLKRDNPNQFPSDWTIEVKTLREVQVGAIRPALLVLLGAVGFVLLIACANVANLMLARAASRRREVAVRTALGARPIDLIRQLLAESLMLSFLGAGAGLALAWGAVRALRALNPGNVPRIAELGIDGRVIAFTALIAGLTGVVFGLVPALQLWRNNLQASIKEGSRNEAGDRGGQVVRRALVVAEIALALMLLAGGGLLIRSFARIAAVDPGFAPDHLMTFTAFLPTAKYPDDTARAQFWRNFFPKLEQVPGVVSAGGTSVLPFGGGWSTTSFNVEGYTPPPKANGPWGDIRLVSPDFLHAMKVPLLKGRMLTDHDDAKAPFVAVVDEEFVRRFYPAGADPIGKRFWFGPATPDDSTRYWTIVGVVAHTAHEGLDADPRIQYYLPVAQTSFAFGGINRLDVAVRTSGDPARMVGALRGAIHAIDPDLPMARVATMDDLISNSLGQRKLSMVLLAVFAGLAALLASLGIYGVMSYMVAQRTRELGVRLALGASTDNVLGLVLRQGVVLTGVGAGLGLAGALALTRLMSAQLYRVRAADPVTFAGVTVLLVGVALGATLIPALRATRIDPLVALREE